MFLTTEEIELLTGHRQAGAQIRWLQRTGYRVVVNALGRPVVARAEVDRKLAGGRTARQEPNYAAINGAP